MKTNLVFNPFEKFSETSLAVAGASFILFSVLLFWFSGQSNDGIYHVTYQSGIQLVQAIIEALSYTFLPFLLLIFAGKMVNPKTRLVDILNATIVHRIPMTIGILLMQLPFLKKVTDAIIKAAQTNTLQQLSIATLWISTITSLVMLALLVYSIVLLINGFKTASHAKKPWHYILFALAIICSELIYRLGIYPFLSERFT
ncbi:YIP1 family protein [Niabella sp. 22666]|uniref:YIP1 family protein n=1 Tax=Niabella sp. 22666 TaxID=3453954 RepID=UPI003F82BFA6